MAIAAQSGNLDIVLEMIAYGARDVNWAMVTAAGAGHKKIVEEMFVRGARAEAQKGGHMDIVWLLGN